MSRESDILRPSSGSIIPGEWNSNFKNGLDYAQEHHMPIYVLWSPGNGCGNCYEYVKYYVGTESFSNWLKYRKIIAIYAEGDGDAKDFAKNDGKHSISAYPFSKIYWQKDDGSTVQFCWSRFLDGDFGTNPGGYSEEDLAKQMIMTIEFRIAGWKAPNVIDAMVISVAHAGPSENRLNGITHDVDVIENLALCAGVNKSMIFKFKGGIDSMSSRHLFLDSNALIKIINAGS